MPRLVHGAQPSQLDALKEIRSGLYEATCLDVDPYEYADGDWLADEIFNAIAALLKRRFGLSLAAADDLLADTRADAARTLGNAIEDRADLDDVIDAVARHLAEERVS
jgi:hypothetical protein